MNDCDFFCRSFDSYPSSNFEEGIDTRAPPRLLHRFQHNADSLFWSQGAQPVRPSTLIFTSDVFFVFFGVLLVARAQTQKQAVWHRVHEQLGSAYASALQLATAAKRRRLLLEHVLHPSLLLHQPQPDALVGHRGRHAQAQQQSTRPEPLVRAKHVDEWFLRYTGVRQVKRGGQASAEQLGMFGKLQRGAVYLFTVF